MEQLKNILILDVNNIMNNKIYIEEEFNNQNSIKAQLIESTSWVDMVEEELTSSSESKTFKVLNKSLDGIEDNDISDILYVNFHMEKELNIMKYQTNICTYLRKELKITNESENKINEKLLYEDLISKIEWLIISSKYLSDKLGLITFKHQDLVERNISRSSYKFCNYNFECQFNYNIKKHNGCFAQHYVHNLVYADLNALKNYINDNQFKYSKEEINKEISKSIITITYVIGHMYEELKNAERFNFFNMKKQHIERTPSKKNKNINQTLNRN